MNSPVVQGFSLNIHQCIHTIMPGYAILLSSVRLMSKRLQHLSVGEWAHHCPNFLCARRLQHREQVSNKITAIVLLLNQQKGQVTAGELISPFSYQIHTLCQLSKCGMQNCECPRPAPFYEIDQMLPPPHLHMSFILIFVLDTHLPIKMLFVCRSNTSINVEEITCLFTLQFSVVQTSLRHFFNDPVVQLKLFLLGDDPAFDAPLRPN